MVELSAIGFGLSPGEKKKAQAIYLAQACWPFLREAVESARDGKVSWNQDRLEVAFMALDELAPIIDDSDMDEVDKLMLHGVLGGLVKMRTSGMMNDRKMKIVAAIADVGVEIYAQAAGILQLEVDRSGYE